MTGKYSACLRVGFLWALTFAVILCTGFVLPVRASGTYGDVAQASETYGEETPSDDAAQASETAGEETPSDNAQASPMPPNNATQAPPGAGMPPNNAMQGPPGARMGMPPNNAMQGPPGAGMGMPPDGPGGPPTPPGMSSGYSYGPSEVTLEEFLTLTANVILLACGIAFALRYHRGRKSF